MTVTVSADPDEGRRWPVKVVTVSDGVVAGTRQDRSGSALVSLLGEGGFDVVETVVTPDGMDEVASVLREVCRSFSGLVVTTGGTGFGPRDLTPEGTSAVIEREAPGLAEAMRACNPLGRLSRGVAGTVGTSLVLNVPGSTKGAVECVEAVLDVLPHALALMASQPDRHPSGEPGGAAESDDVPRRRLSPSGQAADLGNGS